MKLEDTMHFLWNKYLETKDMRYLAEACEKAPFFGQEDKIVPLTLARDLSFAWLINPFRVTVFWELIFSP
jgi:hypothetical protein